MNVASLRSHLTEGFGHSLSIMQEMLPDRVAKCLTSYVSASAGGAQTPKHPNAVARAAMKLSDRDHGDAGSILDILSARYWSLVATRWSETSQTRRAARTASTILCSTETRVVMITRSM